MIKDYKGNVLEIGDTILYAGKDGFREGTIQEIHITQRYGRLYVEFMYPLPNYYKVSIRAHNGVCMKVMKIDA